MLIMLEDIPEDNIQGLSRNLLTDFARVNNIDVLNTKMFRDGTMTSIGFHQHILHQLYIKALKSNSKQSVELESRDNSKKTKIGPHAPKERIDHRLQIEIQEAVESPVKNFGNSIGWNKMFHMLLVECELTSLFNLNKFPKSYMEGEVYGYSLQVELDSVRYHTIHLTILDSVVTENQNTKAQFEFIDAVMYNNPLWDTGQ